MTTLVESTRAEYLRYKTLAEAAMSQLSEAELSATGPGQSDAYNQAPAFERAASHEAALSERVTRKD